MGRSSDWALEVWEQQFEEKRADWIRRELNDLEADEGHPKWDELSELYDQAYSDWEEFLEDEYLWHKDQDHSAFYIEFLRAIDALNRLLSSHLDPNVSDTVIKMAYVQAVTAMETFLSDTLKTLVLGKPQYIANAATNLKEVVQQKFTLSDFVQDSKIAEKVVFEQLCKYLYHDVPKVLLLYRETLGFSLTYDLKQLIQITKNRHDLVHRNGKGNDGKRLQLDFTTVNSAIVEVCNFVGAVEKGLEGFR
ncbi:HEPN domain-containing protein [Limnobacter sp.]|uniref:HEPN domain-containing protein n=1 Tax=Limnobacter sp. TaxID=2003368 RepID=UPI0039198FD1